MAAIDVELLAISRTFEGTGGRASMQAMEAASSTPVDDGGAQRADEPRHSHLLQLYQHETFLGDLVADFMIGGLQQHEQLVVMFMLEQHSRELEEELALATRSETLLNGTIELLRSRLASAADIVRDAVPAWTDDLEAVRRHVVAGDTTASLELLAQISHKASALRSTLMLSLDKRGPVRRGRM